VLRGEAAFLEHYQAACKGRWPALLGALKQAPRRVLRTNAFATMAGRDAEALTPMPGVAGCYLEPTPGKQLLEARGLDGLRRYYAMDAASVVAARALGVVRGERVMDMCAAPGGKALLLAEALAADGELMLNDRSKSRLARLKRVLSEYVSPAARETIELSCGDGRRVGRRSPERYDAILVDAPCSSERHVLSHPSELAKWSPSRIRRLGADQFALLSSAFLALKVGGRLVYCTCALLPEENDDVVARLLERRGPAVEVDPVTAPFGESTRHGWQVWPDHGGVGPMYFSRLRKVRPLTTMNSDSNGNL
jgi:16S rRNA C967 or C1407 C5-methylase (RsmB/RsmF family)